MPIVMQDVQAGARCCDRDREVSERLAVSAVRARRRKLSHGREDATLDGGVDRDLAKALERPVMGGGARRLTAEFRVVD
jgi:hypothetical protein